MNKEHRELLQERSRNLAREPEASDAGREMMDVVAFSLAGESYAIDSSFVREIYPLKAYTPLPGTPDFVLGIMNIRGQILSVVNLKTFFQLPETGLGELNKVLRLSNENMEFGILADEVIGTQQIAKDTIQPAIPTIIGRGAEYLLGVSRESILVLNVLKILEDKSLVIDTK
ncbi:MAG: chemotaxis protein CheW [Bacteroidales bacterium]